jgi:hypothetical protein
LRAQLAKEQAESKLLRDRIAKLTEQIAEAKKKNADLRAKLARPGPPPNTAAETTATSDPPVANGEIKPLKWPKRKLGGLGMVRASQTKLVNGVEGAKRIHLAPFETTIQPKGVLISSNADASEITFLCKSTQRNIAVGVLKLDSTGLVWSWKPISPSGMKAGLESLDSLLKTSIIELRDDRRTLVRYQAAPESITLGIRQSAADATRLSFKISEMVLATGKVSDEWQTDSSNPSTLCFEAANTSFQVTLNVKKGILGARWSQMSPQLKEIDDEISGWRNDNQKLRNALASRTGRNKAMYTAQIKTNEDRIKKLQAKRNKTIAIEARKRKTPVNVSGCNARIILPNGVVLYRVKFVNTR